MNEAGHEFLLSDALGGLGIILMILLVSSSLTFSEHSGAKKSETEASTKALETTSSVPKHKEFLSTHDAQMEIRVSFPPLFFEVGGRKTEVKGLTSLLEEVAKKDRFRIINIWTEDDVPCGALKDLLLVVKRLSLSPRIVCKTGRR
jgi:hypothetical protein